MISQFNRQKTKLAGILLGIILVMVLTSCTIPKRVMAEERIFLDLSLEFLGEYQLPKKMTYQDTVVGGLSGLVYDRQKNLFYAVSDDRSRFSPARFYTLNLIFDRDPQDKIKIDKVEIENVTFLSNEKGEQYPIGTIDSEAIDLSGRGTLFISSEGDRNGGVDPFIGEFDVQTGKLKQKIPIPQRYLPNQKGDTTQPEKGIQNNLAFESLTLNPNSLSPEDPFRLFVATESSLIQDGIVQTPEEKAKIRLMHYVISPFGDPILVAEHLYLFDPISDETLSSGLSELTALPKEGYFLSLERSTTFTGFEVKIFQVAINDASDTATIPSLKGDISQIRSLRKKLLLDLGQLGIELDNLEGMTLGPRLPDGSQSLILISDDNFTKDQVTQFLLFRLRT